MTSAQLIVRRRKIMSAVLFSSPPRKKGREGKGKAGEYDKVRQQTNSINNWLASHMGCLGSL